MSEDERSDAHDTETMAGHENKGHEIADRVSQRQNFGCHAAFGTAGRLWVPCYVLSVAVDCDDWWR